MLMPAKMAAGPPVDTEVAQDKEVAKEDSPEVSGPSETQVDEASSPAVSSYFVSGHQGLLTIRFERCRA